MHMNALCHFNTIQPIYQICNHTTCNSILINNSQISSLELITIPFPMAYTHSYIPYNCDIMLIHKVHALTYSFPHKSSHSLQTISYSQNMDVFGPIHTNPGLFLTVLKQSSGLSVGSPLTKHRVHFVEPNSTAIPSLMHTKTQFNA